MRAELRARGSTLMSFALPIRECDRCPIGVASAPRGCPFACERRGVGRHLGFSGAEVDKAVFVKRGYVTLEQGSRTALRGPGALLGVECLVPRPRASTVVAVTDVEICTLSAPELRVFALVRPGALLQLLSAELAQRELDASFCSGSAEARLCRFLAERRQSGGGEHPLPFTQETLARLLDLRPETLSRVLKELRKKGVISAEGLFVKDASLLRTLARGEQTARA